MFGGDEHECLNVTLNDWNDMSDNGCIWYLYFGQLQNLTFLAYLNVI